LLFTYLERAFMRKSLLLICLSFLIGIGMATAQNTKKVSGVVTSSEDGQPILGASVIVKGMPSVGAVTDMDGKFVINKVPASARTLVVSYVGMVTKEVAIQSNMRVVLNPDTKTLDDVIVVAYGTQKKSSFTGAASTVGSQALEKRAITNATAALEGTASGVQVTAATGQPGDASSIRIRGFGSVNASSAPLFVVDGTIYNGSISDINPADIESMTILKDAASTSLYGSSAGNGVILITTKKGKGAAGSSSINLTINQGWSRRAYKDYAKVNLMEYYPLQWTMLKNLYVSKGSSQDVAAAKASSNIVSDGDYGLLYNPFVGVADDALVGTDGTLNANASSLKWGDDLNWEDAAYKTGYRQEYLLNYSTKTDKSDTYASMGYLKDQGYMIKTNFERYSGRLNYNFYPYSWFKSGMNLSFSRSTSNYSSSTSGNTSSYSNLTRFVRGMAPIYPIHKHDLTSGAYVDVNGAATTDPSKYVYDYDGTRLTDPGRDAIAETYFNTREFARTSENGHVYMTITPMKNLDFTVNYSLENFDLRSKEYENPYVGDGTAGPGRLKQTQSRGLTQTLNQIITYKRSFGLHNFDAMLGHENYTFKYEYNYGMKTHESVTNDYEFINFVTVGEMSSYTDKYKKEGYFGRLNYDYAGKYYGSLSYRHDGSSRFSKDNRWGDFWSFGASWRISEENFMKSIKWVNNLKLRASYGETGNDAILDTDGNDSFYPYQNLYLLGMNNSGEPGLFYSTISDPNLKWETQVATDVALEFGLFDRLTGTIEFFNKSSKDLLFDVSQPSSTGVNSVIHNIGKVSNKGIEVELNYDFLKGKMWRLSAGANATFLKNKIVKLPEAMRENGYITGTKKWMEGKSIYQFWLRQWYGVDPATGNGLYLLDTDAYNEKDGTITTSVQNSLVTINGESRQLTNNYAYAKYDYSGTSNPKMYGGFNFKFGYKNFDLTAVFSYQLGGKVLDSNYQDLMSMSKMGYSMSTDVRKAWKQAGDVTDVPRLDNNSTHASNVGATSTRWLISSNCLNLRSVSLSYEMPQDLISKVLLKSARINLTAENLFMLKKRQGLNPMGHFNGITYNEYMPARTITVGLNLSF
jgi:TonB-linked SusC/RagA family outer membrane protein